jgi:hypothetical protein
LAQAIASDSSAAELLISSDARRVMSHRYHDDLVSRSAVTILQPPPPIMLNSASMARPWAAVSPIDALVERATDPMLEEPNFAVNLELAEYVNSKKANT